MKYVIDIEFSLTQEELDDLAELSKEWNKEFSDTMRECMMTYCRNTLETFKKNNPSNPFDTLSGGVTVDDSDDCLGCQ